MAAVPVVTLLSPSPGATVEMSRVSGWDSVTVQFTGDTDYTRYRIMANGGGGHDIGVEVGRGGGGLAGVQASFEIAAAVFEYMQIDKLWRLDVYVLGKNGVWSDGTRDTKPFITEAAAGTRNDYNGSVGYEFECMSDTDVSLVGRPLNGAMNQTHTVYLWEVITESLLASAEIKGDSPLDALGFKTAPLDRTVTLKAGERYRIVSAEWGGGDRWYDIDLANPLKRTDDFIIVCLTYGMEGMHSQYPENIYLPGGSNGYVGVTFFYTAAAPKITSLTVKSPPARTEYDYGEPLSLDGLIIALSYSDGTSADIPYADFAANGITVSPNDGAVLTDSDSAIVIMHTDSGLSAVQPITVAVLMVVTGITAEPKTASVASGGKSQFTATVTTNTGLGDKSVTWTVLPSGNKSSITNAGLLTVHNSQKKGDVITVRATSVLDGTKYAEATVTVS